MDVIVLVILVLAWIAAFLVVFFSIPVGLVFIVSAFLSLLAFDFISAIIQFLVGFLFIKIGLFILNINKNLNKN